MPQTSETLTALESLRFDNRYTRELPGDPEASNFRRQVRGACYSRVTPTRVTAPQLIAYSREVCELLDLQIDPFADETFAEVFVGNRVLSGMDPHAMCYGGHQFGSWAGQLGDGRAINLGEVVNHRGERWVLQLKGAGLTPYSRTADGLAVLRSSVREFLCSEAMHHLGVPTTRALSLVLTGESVLRDMFYDGNPRREPGAVVCRVAPSFLRFGNYEIFASRNDLETLRTLADYTIRTDFPHLVPGDDASRGDETWSEAYLRWFDEVCRRTAEMIVHWMRVGFVHGVMNTDNMSILGLTIDYGPYGWLEDYDPDWTPNTTDAHGRRYRFGNQPQVALWNLLQLANALVPLIGRPQPLEESLRGYTEHFENGWRQMMAGKLGLDSWREDDESLVSELFEWMSTAETDMTIFFRGLSAAAPDDADAAEPEASEIPEVLRESFYRPEQLSGEVRAAIGRWIARYRERTRQSSFSPQQRVEVMQATNPKYVLRNYLAQLAIDQAENGDASLITELLDVLRRPYDEQPDKERFAAKRPDWARTRAGCSMLSCSS